MAAAKPLIGVTVDTQKIKLLDYHIAGDKYVSGVVDGADAVAVAVPALGDATNGGRLDMAALLDRLDGLLVTGAASHVEPRHYGGAASRPELEHDPGRDATTLPLIRAALAAGVPLFGLCRGCQELNVALGGTLHQHVHELPGMFDHRAPEDEDLDVRYGPRHDVRLAEGGLLAALAAENGLDPTAITVNSLHAQGIDRLADGLTVEAVSSDGLIEAVAVDGAASFALGVQWHPEYRLRENRFSLALFEAFGAAARARLAAR